MDRLTPRNPEHGSTDSHVLPALRSAEEKDIKMKDTIEYRGKTIRIEQDEDTQSPQGFGDDGLLLIAKHRDFFVPPSPKERNFDVQEEIDARKKTHWIFQLEAYIHSGVVLALRGEGNFPDRQWDMSHVGAVFVAKKEWRLSAKARKAAECYIGEWNKYLSGDVWGYVVGEDSCCGFYGFDYCVQEAKHVIDHQIERGRKERITTLKTLIRNRVPLLKRQEMLA